MNTVTVMFEAVSELIDTQWDVNATKKCCKDIKKIELIDTQWDVNVIEYNSGL